MYGTRLDWRVFVVALSLGVVGSSLPAAEEAPNEELVKMITDLVSDADRDMRALGFQQIREECPGEPATMQFAALLSTLKPEAQAGLLEALGDRGDRAARPAVLSMLKSDDAAVRAASIQAIGSLGSAEDVPMLAEKTSSDAKEDRDAARASLLKLRGKEINGAILAALAKADPKAREVLLGVLAARNAKDAVPAILEQARDPDAAVRIAALDALRQLADAASVVDMVKLVTEADSPEVRRRADLALRTVCGRHREECVGPVAESLQSATPEARQALLRSLARAGGGKAVEAIASQLDSNEEAVRREALRLMCHWPDRSAVPYLVKKAEGADDPQTRVLVIRGLVRLAGAQGEQPADLPLLAKAMSLSNRAAEKRLVLGALSAASGPDAIRAAAPLIENSEVAPEACLAVVTIAERLAKVDDADVKAALDKVAGGTKDNAVRDRAKKALERK